MTDHTELDAYIASLNLVYNVTFVPQSASRNAGSKDKSLNWRIVLGDAKRPNALTTDYSQGIGHVPGYVQDRSYYENRVVQDVQNNASETRLYPVLESFARNDGKKFKRVGFRNKTLAPPALRDVLYSLVLDSGVLDSRSFEDWASEFGYDTDSRKAEDMYRACRDIAYKMESLIGRPALQKLRELFQDY